MRRGAATTPRRPRPTEARPEEQSAEREERWRRELERSRSGASRGADLEGYPGPGALDAGLLPGVGVLAPAGARNLQRAASDDQAAQEEAEAAEEEAAQEQSAFQEQERARSLAAAAEAQKKKAAGSGIMAVKNLRWYDRVVVPTALGMLISPFILLGTAALDIYIFLNVVTGRWEKLPFPAAKIALIIVAVVFTGISGAIILLLAGIF